nr:MAG TPA: hypothetical protein [Caudoviricetes sp.]
MFICSFHFLYNIKMGRMLYSPYPYINNVDNYYKGF